MIALLLSLARAEEPPRAADLIAQSSEWSVYGQMGVPWSGVRAQRGLGTGWTLTAEIDSALWNRWQPSVGIARALGDYLTLEVLGGWQLQSGPLVQRGPSAAVRLHAGIRLWRLIPALHLSSRHLLRIDRTVVLSETGRDVTLDPSHQWSPSGALTLGVVLTESVVVQGGLEYHRPDLVAAAIPGLHLGVWVRR